MNTFKDSSRGVEEGCLPDRGREGGSRRGGGETSAQYSFKLTEAVCVLVCTSLRSVLALARRSAVSSSGEKTERKGKRGMNDGGGARREAGQKEGSGEEATGER